MGRRRGRLGHRLLNGPPLLLGIDIGTSHTKAVLVDPDGRTAAAATVPTGFDARNELTVDALDATLRAVIAGLGDAASRRRIATVGLAGIAESGAPLDVAGRALAPVIAWYDRRGEDVVARLNAAFGAELALRLGQPVRPVMTAAKLGWLLAHGELAAPPARWLGVPELALYALTGAHATEYSLAARTGCYDVVDRTWLPYIASDLGFSVDIFPPVAPAGAVMGRTRGDPDLGLPAGIPVTIAGHDHLAGMAGAAVRTPEELGNSVGTAETVVAVTAAPPDMATALAHRIAVSVAPGGREWAAFAGAARAGIVLESAAALLRSTSPALDDLAAAATAAAAGGLDDYEAAIDALGHGKPAALPDGEPGPVWAGLLDALAARTADATDRLLATLPADPAPRRVIVFGGGAVSDPWLRAKARHIGLPVAPSPVTSAAARGAALQAGVAAGWWPDAAAAPVPLP